MRLPERGTRKDQVGYGIMALACGSLLVLAGWLSPSSEGTGTHTQMGLDKCGFKMASGLPCPTCGCTTSVALAADGRFIDSLINQPFGFSFSLITGCLFLIGLFGAWSGQPLEPFLAFVFRPFIWIGFSILLVLAWGWKILLTLGEIV